MQFSSVDFRFKGVFIVVDIDLQHWHSIATPNGYLLEEDLLETNPVFLSNQFFNYSLDLRKN